MKLILNLLAVATIAATGQSKVHLKDHLKDTAPKLLAPSTQYEYISLGGGFAVQFLLVISQYIFSGCPLGLTQSISGVMNTYINLPTADSSSTDEVQKILVLGSNLI